MSAPPPTVTGISPNEGHPGTKIIIRGEHLGRTQHDLLSILINDDECVATAEWHSPNKLTARCGRNQGTGPVIVTTKTGGRGTCTVSFRIYTIRIGLTTEVGYWYDEAKQWEARRGRIMFVSDTANPAQAADSNAHRADDANPLGLDDPGEQVLGEQQLMQILPEACGDLNMENFSPAWYILQHHSTASLRDLERALRLREERKRRERETSTNDMVLYVKDFLVSFFECVDTLDHLDARIGDDRRKLNDAIGGLNVLCTKMEQDIQGTFGEIFARRRNIEELKKLSGIVTKYSYLWTTLSSINRARQNRNFTLIISETKKLKTLLEQVPENVVFRQIMLPAVDADIVRLNQHLHEQLLATASVTPDEQIHLADLISELGIENQRQDALWACIKQLHAFTLEQMRQFFVNKSSDFAKNGEHGTFTATLPKLSAYLTRKAYFEPTKKSNAVSTDSVFDDVIASFIENELGLTAIGSAATPSLNRLPAAISEWTQEVFTLATKRCEHLLRLWQKSNHFRAALDELRTNDVNELQKRFHSLLESIVCQACITLETLVKFVIDQNHREQESERQDETDSFAVPDGDETANTNLRLKPRHLIVLMADSQEAIKKLLDLGVATGGAVQHLKFFTRGAGLALVSAVLKQAESDAKLLCLTSLLNVKALEFLPRVYEVLLNKLIANLALVQENDNNSTERCFNRATAESIANVLRNLLEMPLKVFDDKNWRRDNENESSTDLVYMPVLLSILALLKLRYNIISAVLHLVQQQHSVLIPNEFLHQLQLQLFQSYTDRQNLLAALFIETTVQQLFMRELRVEMESLAQTVQNVWSPTSLPPQHTSATTMGAAADQNAAPARECFVKFLMRILQRMNEVTAVVNHALVDLQQKQPDSDATNQVEGGESRALFSARCREIIETFLQDYCQALAISLATELNRYIRLEKVYDKHQTAAALGCIYIVQNSLQRFLSDDGHFLLNSASEWVLECFEQRATNANGGKREKNGEADADAGKAAVVRLVKQDVDLFFKRNAIMLALSKMSMPSV